jgi:hypothetical protein
MVEVPLIAPGETALLPAIGAVGGRRDRELLSSDYWRGTDIEL